MPETSSRHKLPYLIVAQAEKELTHNEALARIDGLLHPVVQARIAVAPMPVMDDAGKCWLIDVDAIGDWADRGNQIAVWAGGSWRYLNPVPGMRLRNLDGNADTVWNGLQWIDPPIVSEPQSGSTIDVEARTAINALLAHFRMIGHLAE